jgi:DHA3 family tetracycline resistance protein-like MFS transporter
VSILRLRPVPAYLLLTGGYAFLFSLAITVNLVYQTQQANLSPLQLLLVGTALETTIFLCEVPTGVLADLRGRRISVVTGMCLIGLGMVLTGAWARFETILLAQLVWGLGSTFISGAQQAWIADEIGIQQAGPVYLRASQVDQLLRIVAIPVSIGLATLKLGLPLIVAGGLLPVLALYLLIAMPEEGFKRDIAAGERISFRHLSATTMSSGRLIRGSPLLITLFTITVFYGIANQGFDRLWVTQFYHNLGFPTFHMFQPVVWFGVIRFGSAVLSILAVEYALRRADTNSHASVSRWLFVITALQMLCLLVFALAGNFWLGALVVWGAISLSRVYDPLLLAWINQNVPAQVRATVISMSSQTSSIGQISGGPVLGLVSVLSSLRAALVVSGLVMTPALALYTRAFGQGKTEDLAKPDDAGGIA